MSDVRPEPVNPYNPNGLMIYKRTPMVDLRRDPTPHMSSNRSGNYINGVPREMILPGMDSYMNRIMMDQYSVKPKEKMPDPVMQAMKAYDYTKC